MRRRGGWPWALVVGAVAVVALLAIGWTFLGEEGLRDAWDELVSPASPEIPFTVPEGFVAELVARPPLVQFPMFACLDDRGRLYVAGSSGGSLNAAQRLEAPPDVIRRLEDTDGDGTYDKCVIFADRLTFPQGLVWHDGAIITASPPSLWRLEDTDGDGKADRRDELLTGFPFTGIADDFHGPCLGPDGRIYCGVGRFSYDIRRPGGPTIRKGSAPIVIRCRPDGSEVEIVSAGLGNPVEVAFSAEGEVFACGTFLATPEMGEGTRDAIIHCVEGGVFPVRDRNSSEDRRTGDLLPPMTHLGVAAPSGLIRIRSGRREDEARPVLFSALFNMHKVQRHILERDGATYRSRDEDFLVSDVTDFHPTDVLEDADGSLLVVDTGGWFRHCPTSQIARRNVKGAIYRIRRSEARRVDDPRGLALEWSACDPDELIRRLDNDRFAVRERAVSQLASGGPAIVPVLRNEVLRGDSSARARIGALWALYRIDGPAARAAVRAALDDADPGVRLVAATVAGRQRDPEGVGRLVGMLERDTPAIRREAATALGRIGRTEAVAALLEGLRAGGDRFLEHASIFALISIDDRRATAPGLTDPSPNVRRAALIALDQMDGGRLTPADVTPLLDPEAPALQQAALRVIGAHPAWAHDLVGLFRAWLCRGDLADEQREALRNALPAFSHDTAIRELVASAMADGATPVPTRTMLLEVVAGADAGGASGSWLEALGRCLEDRDERVVRQAAVTAGALGVDAFDETLLRLARDPSRPKDLRLDAIEAVVPRLEHLDRELLSFLTERLEADESPLYRMAAARCLGRSHLDATQLLELSGAVARAGALTLPRLLPAFGQCADRQVGARLVAALSRAPGLRSLTPAVLRKALESYPAEVQAEASTLFQRLDVREEEMASRLAELEPLAAGGEPRRGREVFFGARAACSTCHTAQSQGGRVGPDLSRIG
ncbi:MAG TPA: PVC-type heme-binding CxxCH protein [Isosphaeraceae bacterium]